MPALEKTSSASKNFCRVLDIRVPECVRMDVRKVVLFTEVIQPVSDTVRIHQVSIITGKDISVLSPLISTAMNETTVRQNCF